jgi:hypothetical protein
MRNTITVGLCVVATLRHGRLWGFLHNRAFSITADTSAVPTGTSGTRSSPTGTAAPEAKTII